MKLIYILISLLLFHPDHAEAREVSRLESPDGLNTIFISLTAKGCPTYRIERKGNILIRNSAIGLRCETQDFSQNMTLHEVGKEELYRQTYQLLVGNQLSVNSLLARKQVRFKNEHDSILAIDLVAGNEGIAFRCRLQDSDDTLQTVTEEVTAFEVPLSAKAWLQPYHAAGRFTPAYEDFFFRVSPGDLPPRSRQKPRGWCLPGLFHLEAEKSWILLAESDVDGSYCASHLEEDPSSKGRYQIAFAYEDEVTGAKTFDQNANKASVRTSKTPWRVIILADQAGGILNSTLVTDLAAPSRIEDTSWIQPGRASWGWWSHPKGPTDQALFDEFTDLAAEFGWEYTLFDAGWWKTDIGLISSYAKNKSVKPMAWTHAKDFLDPAERRQKLDEMASHGVCGIKVDFWCSDRQETMAAMLETLEEAAKRKMVVNFHGCTIPRAWHRTWPNLLTAEAVLGTESYFFESRYPARTAQQNTILPFTRNVIAPMDYTPVAMTMRKFPRKTSAAHELAAALAFNSGIVHYADSTEMFRSFPKEVKQILRIAPAAWDQTLCLIGDPGRLVVIARRVKDHWFIVGLNGTSKTQAVDLDLKRFGQLASCTAITEGQEPLMQFNVQRISDPKIWNRKIPPFGGFTLHLTKAPIPKSNEPLTRTINFQNTTRQYFIRLPKDFDPNNTYWPLVVVHGGGGQALTNPKAIAIRRLADNLNLPAIVISPEFNTQDKQVSRFPALGEGEFLKQVLKNVRAEFKLHPKILLTGYSMGGQFSHRFALSNPDMVQACAPFAAGTWSTPDGRLLIQEYGEVKNPKAFLSSKKNAEKVPERLRDIFDSRTAEIATLPANKNAKNVPFLIMCGTLDPRLSIAKDFAASLQKAGFQVEYDCPITPHSSRSKIHKSEFEKYPTRATLFFKKHLNK